MDENEIKKCLNELGDMVSDELMNSQFEEIRPLLNLLRKHGVRGVSLMKILASIGPILNDIVKCGALNESSPVTSIVDMITGLFVAIKKNGYDDQKCFEIIRIICFWVETKCKEQDAY